jgi:hypothetical protein
VPQPTAESTEPRRNRNIDARYLSYRVHLSVITVPSLLPSVMAQKPPAPHHPLLPFVSDKIASSGQAVGDLAVGVAVDLLTGRKRSLRRRDCANEATTGWLCVTQFRGADCCDLPVDPVNDADLKRLFSPLCVSLGVVLAMAFHPHFLSKASRGGGSNGCFPQTEGTSMADVLVGPSGQWWLRVLSGTAATPASTVTPPRPAPIESR